MKNLILLLVSGIFFISCSNEQKGQNGSQQVKENNTTTDSKAQEIVDKAINTHGGTKITNSIISFDFRDKHYVATRNGGSFTYERIFEDSVGNKIHDVLTNDGFNRNINGQLANITEERKSAYSNSVNSVIYFALLPYFLNDGAVNKAYLGEGEIAGETYQKIKITFGKKGGGKDHEDEFVYWFHKESNTMDFLAYNYQTEGGGARFRKGYNMRTIEGIRFADFVNYAPREKRMDVENFDSLFVGEKLDELSRIELKYIKVSEMPQ
ncbi:DUF6503 family protein [Flexithrix dorotheae]|uniref:DUF6503 family protein n=1 Tax=Flexithrix dorotheae TaxID=70993 RepID=UPI00035DDB83|nr:DUF6503 family protein [Flexithrix dorotheae]